MFFSSPFVRMCCIKAMAETNQMVTMLPFWPLIIDMAKLDCYFIVMFFQ